MVVGSDELSLDRTRPKVADLLAPVLLVRRDFRLAMYSYLLCSLVICQGSTKLAMTTILSVSSQ